LPALVAIAAAVSGCGFHFRGDVGFPPEMAVTYINTADRYSPFYRALTRVLDRGGVRVTDDPAAADATIRVHQDSTGQRVLTVSARNTPREYDVFYTVRYSVLADGREVLPEQTLTLTQDYTFDERRVLGKRNEEQVLREAIAADLVDLVVQQLKIGTF